MLRPVVPALPLLLVPACAVAPTEDGVEGPPAQPVRHALPAGTVLGLAPVEASSAGVRTDEIAGLLREALVQSERFDLAAGVAAGPAEHGLRVHCDVAAKLWTATLERPGEPSVPLAAVPIADAAPHRALDELALRSRQALGETVAAWPVPVALAYSQDPEAVSRGEVGWERFARGDIVGAQEAFEKGRPRDGGSPVILQGLAACAAMTGDHEAVEKLAREALDYESRLHPTARHRLFRSLLLARAALEPGRHQALDEELLQFGQVGRRERPFDPEPQITEAMAHNLLGDAAAALALLQPLHARLPEHSLVAYHLTYAALAGGQPELALEAIDSIGNRLGPNATVMPRALALYHAERHEELEAHLDRLANLRSVRTRPALHEIRRMQAAHAILIGDRDRAVETLLEDVTWLRNHPSLLDARALHLAEAGEVLVRLGAAAPLARTLTGFHDLGKLPAAVVDSLVFVQGLVECATTGDRATTAEASLRRGSGSLEVWGNVVKAFGHHQRGELKDRASALARAAQFSEAPLIKAALAHAWQAMGKHAEAQAVLDAIHREQFVFDLRLPERHPLLNPATALACLRK